MQTNETRSPDSNGKDIRIPLPGLVDRALVAILGALLGIGGSFTVQKLEPNARALPFTSADHVRWVESTYLPHRDKENEKLEKVQQLISANANTLNWFARQIAECERARAEDDKAVDAINESLRLLWEDHNAHVKGLKYGQGGHPPLDYRAEIDGRLKALEMAIGKVEK